MIDLFLTLFTMALVSPLLLLLASMVRLFMGSPILFRQLRPGLHGKPFCLLKFRSMTNRTGPDGRLLPDAERLTRFGRFLRSFSMDELPGLLNVVKGDMSLVGPRPLLMRYMNRYTPEQARRHEVKPGLTGWAQIHGRNDLIWDEKFKLDVWYVDHRSLRLDLKIIAMTIAKILRREGINQAGQATMEEFDPQNERSGVPLA
jgi:sugar transferase EpsL